MPALSTTTSPVTPVVGCIQLSNTPLLTHTMRTGMTRHQLRGRKLLQPDISIAGMNFVPQQPPTFQDKNSTSAADPTPQELRHLVLASQTKQRRSKASTAGQTVGSNGQGGIGGNPSTSGINRGTPAVPANAAARGKGTNARKQQQGLKSSKLAGAAGSFSAAPQLRAAPGASAAVAPTATSTGAAQQGQGASSSPGGSVTYDSYYYDYANAPVLLPFCNPPKKSFCVSAHRSVV